jgi:glyoxylate reductase
MINELYPVIVWPGELPPAREQLIEQVRGIDGILCLLTDRIDEELMDLIGPQLKVISNMAVGVDNIDVIAATARGIPVGNTPGVLTDATADQAFALMLAAARRLLEADRFLRAGKWVTWSPSLLLGADFVGATLGIIGFGRIGRAIAKRAQGFDMHVIYHDPSASPEFNARPVELDTLLRDSDFVSINVPLTSETYRLVNAKFLSRMRPNAILINTSRGGVVDQDALHDALISRKIFAAALDVTDPEPLPLDCPLLQLENCIIMPHLGSASRRTREMMSMLAAENLIAGIEGKRLPNCVNPEVYSK